MSIMGGEMARDAYTGEPCPWMLVLVPPTPESIVTVLGGEPAPCAPPGAAIIRIVDEGPLDAA